MITEFKRAANAAGGKTARACDGCLHRRARWYCAADDAFLCQACDASVHSANQLASRHERVRLETASSGHNGTVNTSQTSPTWQHGFTRKARTPRNNNRSLLMQQQKSDGEKEMINPVVPELNSEEVSSPYENEEQLLYRVPVFDPFEAELCNMVTSEATETGHEEGNSNMVVDNYAKEGSCDDELDSLHGFLPSDMDLAEFAADVESLLGGGGLDEDACDIQNFGSLDCKEEDENDFVCFEDKRLVKVKEEEEVEFVAANCHFDPAFGETLNWSLDYCESPMAASEEEEKVVPVAKSEMMDKECKVEMKRKMFLRLNYEAVIAAWASQGCPWTTGCRPEINPDDSWPDCMGRGDVHYAYGGAVGCHAAAGGCDGDREARVSRYREKRRTRLFAKKIRYEVRKLNAEKRPRMKGRFVKRTSFVGAVNAFPYFNK